MQQLIMDFERYFKETLDIAVKPAPWKGADRLPFFLRNLYRYFACSLLDVRCLLMAAREHHEQTPAVVRKHIEQVRVHWDGEVIYLHPMVSAFNRKRLIAHKVPFVVPGNQLYLPTLSIDMREHFRKVREDSHMLSPSTQTVVLHALFNPDGQPLTPSAMADRLGYAPMTLGRAFDELEATGLAEVALQGRERVLRFKANKKHLWTNAQEFMRTPVIKRTHLHHFLPPTQGFAAGLTALAQYTMIAPPVVPVYAISAADFKAMKQRNDSAQSIDPMDSERLEVEIWSYPPRLFADADVVDRLSLYLSLRDNKDERIESAMAEMIEAIQW